MQKQIKGGTLGYTSTINCFFLKNPCECSEDKIRQIVLFNIYEPPSLHQSHHSLQESVDVEKYKFRCQMFLELEALQLKIPRFLVSEQPMEVTIEILIN